MTDSTTIQPPRPGTLRRVGLTTCLGTTLEWYDFILYSTAAALIFSSQYFPNISGAAQTMAALSTVTIGYLARPIGSVLFGHFGDRIGRKKLLVLSLLIMGVGTFATGLLPTFDQIGLWAPTLLVIVRFLQGVAIGGEWAGALLMAVEHAPEGKRGFYGSLPMLGAPLGFILSTVVFLLPSAMLSDESFASWGWRIPFLLSVVLVGVGLYMRLQVAESPEFQKVARTSEVVRFPMFEVLRTAWRQVLIGLGIGLPLGVAFYIYSGYVLAYGSREVGIGRTGLLVATLIGAAAWAAVMPYTATLSDRFGRRRFALAGVVLVGVWAFPSFWMIDSGNLVLVTVAVSVGLIAVGITYGPIATRFAEMFDVRMRYSGAGATYVLSGVIGTGPAPVVASALFSATGGSWSIALYMMVLALVGVACVPFARRWQSPATPHSSLAVEGTRSETA